MYGSSIDLPHSFHVKNFEASSSMGTEPCEKSTEKNRMFCSSNFLARAFSRSMEEQFRKLDSKAKVVVFLANPRNSKKI